MPDTDMNDDTTLDLILTRILDRRAAPADWDAFATLASARPEAWPALLSSLRADQGLVHGLDAELAVADRVELPAPGAPVLSLAAARARRPWTGWAAAAVLALAWAGSAWLLPGSGSPAGAPGGGVPSPLAQGPASGRDGAPGSVSNTPPTASEQAPATAPSPGQDSGPLLAQSGEVGGPRLRDGTPDSNLDITGLRGAIVGELPLQLVSTAAAADGDGLDVVYVRPVLERTRVSGLYSLGADELGQPAPVSINPASYLVADSN